MISTRVRIILLFLMNIGLILIPAQMYIVFILVLIIFSVAFRLELLQNLRAIFYYLLFLIIICMALNLLFIDILPIELIFSSLKIFAIITVSVLLVSDLNIMEMIAFLRKARIPQRVAIAIGVGFRYAGLFLEDLKRINFIQSMNGYGLNISSFMRNGILNSIGIFSLPVFLSMLSRTDKISMSILLQEIESRAKMYIFKKTNLVEWLLLTLGVGVILLCGIIYLCPSL